MLESSDNGLCYMNKLIDPSKSPLTKMKLLVPNAIIFVLDPNNSDVVIPEYKNLVSHTESCVSVGTQADVDGETEVVLSRVAPAGLSCVFNGEISTPSGAIAVEISERTSLGYIAGLQSKSRACIWVDDDKWPSQVAVVLID